MPLGKSRSAMFHSCDLYHIRVKSQVLIRFIRHPLSRSLGQASTNVSFFTHCCRNQILVHTWARKESGCFKLLGLELLMSNQLVEKGVNSCMLSINSPLLPVMSNPPGSQISPRVDWDCSSLHHGCLELILNSLHSLLTLT